MASTHIVTVHTFKDGIGFRNKPYVTTHFTESFEAAHILAKRLYDLGGKDVYISEIKTTMYGKR